MEKQNKRLQRAKQLESESKSLRRQEQLFWKEVDERKDEILERFSATVNQRPTETSRF